MWMLWPNHFVVYVRFWKRVVVRPLRLRNQELNYGKQGIGLLPFSFAYNTIILWRFCSLADHTTPRRQRRISNEKSLLEDVLHCIGPIRTLVLMNLYGLGFYSRKYWRWLNIESDLKCLVRQRSRPRVNSGHALERYKRIKVMAVESVKHQTRVQVSNISSIYCS